MRKKEDVCDTSTVVSTKASVSRLYETRKQHKGDCQPAALSLCKLLQIEDLVPDDEERDEKMTDTIFVSS